MDIILVVRVMRVKMPHCELKREIPILMKGAEIGRY